MPDVTVSYDYRCPFAKNIHLHLVAALRHGTQFAVTFAPWTMSQGHKEESEPDVWDDPSRDAEHLALAVSVSVRDEQPEHFLGVHEAFYRARHERGQRLVEWDQIVEILRPLHVDVERVSADVASRRPHRVLADTYREFAGYEAFGVPTFVVNGDATFVRYMDPPTDDSSASVALLEQLYGLMTTSTALNEFKHTRVAR